MDYVDFSFKYAQENPGDASNSLRVLGAGLVYLGAGIKDAIGESIREDIKRRSQRRALIKQRAKTPVYVDETFLSINQALSGETGGEKGGINLLEGYLKDQSGGKLVMFDQASAKPRQQTAEIRQWIEEEWRVMQAEALYTMRDQAAKKEDRTAAEKRLHCLADLTKDDLDRMANLAGRAALYGHPGRALLAERLLLGYQAHTPAFLKEKHKQAADREHFQARQHALSDEGLRKADNQHKAKIGQLNKLDAIRERMADEIVKRAPGKEFIAEHGEAIDRARSGWSTLKREQAQAERGVIKYLKKIAKAELGRIEENESLSETDKEKRIEALDSRLTKMMMGPLRWPEFFNAEDQQPIKELYHKRDALRCVEEQDWRRQALMTYFGAQHIRPWPMGYKQGPPEYARKEVHEAAHHYVAEIYRSQPELELPDPSAWTKTKLRTRKESVILTESAPIDRSTLKPIKPLVQLKEKRTKEERTDMLKQLKRMKFLKPDLNINDI